MTNHTELEKIAPSLPIIPSSPPMPMVGGCIHHAWKWGPFFIKTNSSRMDRAFLAEESCLNAIRRTNTIRVPETITRGMVEDTAFLVLEHLDLVSFGNEALFGEQLAALHLQTSEPYGFPEDNFIGTTTQPNTWTDDWPSFFRDHRIGRLLGLLEKKGIRFPDSDRLLNRLASLLPGQPKPSLLHGDLWSGNKAFLRNGTPVIFDPSSYYGHAACDLAMTGLFGGFGSCFYDAYRGSCKLDDPSLHDIYNLYHVLNHALLFGGSYVAQAGSIIRRFA